MPSNPAHVYEDGSADTTELVDVSGAEHMIGREMSEDVDAELYPALARKQKKIRKNRRRNSASNHRTESRPADCGECCDSCLTECYSSCPCEHGYDKKWYQHATVQIVVVILFVAGLFLRLYGIDSGNKATLAACYGGYYGGLAGLILLIEICSRAGKPAAAGLSIQADPDVDELGQLESEPTSLGMALVSVQPE